MPGLLKMAAARAAAEMEVEMSVPAGHYECQRPDCPKRPHNVLIWDKKDHDSALDRKSASGDKGRVSPNKLARQAAKGRR